LLHFFLILGFITAPLRVVDLFPKTTDGIALIITLLYFAIVVPLALPTTLKTCGIEARPIGSFDKGGTMNKAADEKTKALKREAEVRRGREI